MMCYKIVIQVSQRKMSEIRTKCNLFTVLIFQIYYYDKILVRKSK